MILAALIPTVAHANAGLPMIFAITPIMVCALVPIVIVEALIYAKALGVTVTSAIASSTRANLITTLVGVPMTWGILLIIQMQTSSLANYKLDNLLDITLMITLQSVWVTDTPNNQWFMPASALFLLVIFCITSWKIEYWIIKKYYTNIATHKINKSCLKANLPAIYF